MKGRIRPGAETKAKISWSWKGQKANKKGNIVAIYCITYSFGCTLKNDNNYEPFSVSYLNANGTDKRFMNIFFFYPVFLL